jgi:hypothetical protein
VHASGEDDVGPAQVVLGGGSDILVDKPDFPAGWDQRGDKENALRRHECLDRSHQWKSVVERGKRPCVLWKEAQNPARMLGRELKSEIRHHHLTQASFPGSLLPFSRAVGSLFAAAGQGFLESLFDRFTGFAGALLNAAQQFVVLAFGELEIIVRELGPLLFQLAFGDVPVAFAFERVHNNSFFVLA